MDLLKGLLRVLIYALFALLIAVMLLQIASRSPNGLNLVVVPDARSQGTTEYSPVEQLQNIFLLFSAGIFAWIGFRDRLRRPMAVGLVALFLAFLVRELDYFLDRNFADNLWQVLSAVIFAVAIVYLYRHRKRFMMAWRRTLPSTGLAIILAGLIILIPFGQFMGNQVLWEVVLGDNYVRVARLAAEEIIELAGYMLIVIGSIDFLYSWSRLPKTRYMEAPTRRRRKKPARTRRG